MTETYLAYALQNTYCVLEVTDVKNRDYELDVRIVPHAVNRRQATGFTVCAFLGCSLWDKICGHVRTSNSIWSAHKSTVEHTVLDG